ncbi:MAG: class I SAM-dependent methyltransferase [Propionibacteriaceae bacterium]
MTIRALSFGSVASAYERFRPDYPDELVDQVLAHATHPIHSALEIGAGTGKATRAFARRGITVTATEPDLAMLTELRKHGPATVATRHGALEGLDGMGTFDLVFAAASLHWTEAAGRWSRVAALLNPDGVFASFGGPLRLGDPAVEEAVRVARSPYLADDDVPSPDGTSADSPLQWPGTELVRSGLFIDVAQSVIERRVTMSAHEYVSQLSTISAYLELSDPVRTQAFEQILRVLPDHVTLVADLTLHLARPA